MKKILICFISLFAAVIVLRANPVQDVDLSGVDAAAAAAIAANRGSIDDDLLLTAKLNDYVLLPIFDDDWVAEKCFHVKEKSADWDDCLKSSKTYEVEHLYFYEATQKEIKEGRTDYSETYEDDFGREQSRHIIIYDEEQPNRSYIDHEMVFTMIKWPVDLEHTTQIGCKTYALTDNWLITSATCPLFEQPAQTHSYTVYREIQEISIGGKKLNISLDEKEIGQNIKAGKNIILIHVPSYKNTDVLKKITKKEKVNLLAFTKPENVFAAAAFGNFFVHTSRFDNQRITSNKRSATLKNGFLQGYTFQASSSLNGTATDPLFLITNDKAEYLMAYNTATEEIRDGKKWHGNNSDKYHALSVEDLQFIESSVDKKSFSQLSQHLFIDSPNLGYLEVGFLSPSSY